MKLIIFVYIVVLTLALSAPAWAGKVKLSQDIASLGENSSVLKRAQSLDPNNQVSVVQKRAVDRNSRFELSLDGALISGGDAYLNTQMLGGSLGFHISPNWSAAVRYQSYKNSLTAEGKAFYDSVKVAQSNGANLGGGAQPPAVDSPFDTTMLVVNWYPVYGKMNVGGWIPHFDLYLLAGYGKTNTSNFNLSDTYTAGGGMGIWLTNFLAMRIEARYQTYNDKPYALYGSDAQRRLDQFYGQASLGILL